jgi:Spy/CpxP family protein refolding chaperone
MQDNWRQLGIGIGALALLIGVAVAPMASAQNTSGAPPPFMGRGQRGGPPQGGPGLGLAPRMMNQLGLSEQQREQMKSINEAYREETRALVERQRDAREALNAATRSGVFDEGAVRQQAMTLGQIETDMAVQRARIFSEVYQILTPDQQTQLKALEAERPGPDAGSRGRGMPPRGGRGPGGR